MPDQPAPQPGRWDTYADPLKLTDQQINELLETRAKIAKGPANESDRRAWRRLRVAARLWVPAELRGPTGTASQLRVYPVDISAGGMSFFMGMFVHQGTEFAVTLNVADNEMVTVKGRTVRCVFIKGRVHEVGLKFDEVFDMGRMHPHDGAVAMSVEVEEGASAAAPEQAGPSATERGLDREVLEEMRAMSEEIASVIDKTRERIRGILNRPS